ncbi:Beta-galactosidase [subsurface metagenome]
MRVYRRFKGWQFDTHDAWAISGIYRDVSLFAVGDGHIQDLTVITEVKPDLSSASVQCKVTVVRSSAEAPDFTVSSTLIDPGGRTAGRNQSNFNMRDRKNEAVCMTLPVDNPLLWNAETPHLYDLQLDLRLGSDTVHSVTRKVGIRQVSIDGDVFKLNYRPIKLRGVNHHDIHPDVGRALREEHYRQDIELMKRANINAVRTSHYPPHPIFLDLCDQYGMYVICEVPFGFGDKNLKDQSYGDILLMRAEATVARDKNHPSVLIWSIGNENPITPIVVNTADRVKELDPTRFRLLPGAQDSEGKTPAKGENLTEFAEKTKFIFNLPASVEIAAPHYPYVVQIPDRDRKINLTDLALDKGIQRPVICTEYNHSLGSAFEGLKEHWEMIETYDRLCGAFIWNWSDQGLRRKITGREILTDAAKRLIISSKESTVCADVWLDAETALDSHGGSGSDGIVYADRFPQVDYWITRKVYSQVVIPENRIVVRQGKQKIELAVLNRYDFTNLDKLKGTWELLRDGKRMKSGDILVSAPPHGKDKIAIELDLKDDIETTENLLRIVFVDFCGRQIYERSVHLVPESGKVDFAKRLSVNTPVTPLQPAVKREGISSYQFGNLLVSMDHSSGKVKLLYADSGTSLLEGPIVRVGRTPVMAEWRNYPRYNIKFWENPLLQNRKVIESTSSLTSGGGVELKMKLDYPSLEKNRQGESILVDLRFHVSPKGWIDVDYELTPQNATGNFLDFGLAFKLPGAMKHLTWVGDGPYNSYPGQTDAAERGIWHIAPRPATDPESRYYEGNRANVDMAVVTDGKGNGIGVICNGSTLSLEQRQGQQIFSQVLRSSGKGNKTGGMMTLLPVKAAEVKSEKGTMRFVPLEAGKWPVLFEDVLGPVAAPHAPY